MKKAFDNYRYLAGNTGVSGSLWEGPDHLLYIQSGGFLLAFSETYKRLDYAKIQTISLGRTSTYGWFAFLILVPLVISAAIFVSYISNLGDAGQSPVLGGICLAITLLLTLILIVHLAKGPTCTVKLQTAVQVVNLRPLKRLRSAQQAIARLTELCRTHQGGEAVALESLQGTQAKAAFEQRGVKPPLPRSSLLLVGLPLLALAGVMFAGEPFTPSAGYAIADLLTCLIAHLMILIALARLSRFEMPGALRFSLWGSAANFIVTCAFAYGLLIAGSIALTADAHNRDQTFAAIESDVNAGIFFWLAKAGFNELHGFAWIFVGLGGITLLMSAMGLISLFRFGPAKAVVAAPPPMASPTVQPAANEPTPAAPEPAAEPPSDQP